MIFCVEIYTDILIIWCSDTVRYAILSISKIVWRFNMRIFDLCMYGKLAAFDFVTESSKSEFKNE